MITIIFGKPGKGKTSLMAHLMTEIYMKKRHEMMKVCADLIEAENRDRKYALPFPEKPPIFSNFAVEFLVGFEKKYSPYYLNPYFFGIENDEFPVQHILLHRRRTAVFQQPQKRDLPGPCVARVRNAQAFQDRHLYRGAAP